MGEICSRHGSYVNSIQTSSWKTSRQGYFSYPGYDALQFGKYFTPGHIQERSNISLLLQWQIQALLYVKDTGETLIKDEDNICCLFNDIST
jgi:hypothetical protein